MTVKKPIIGKNFIVKRCARCRQLVLDDPAHPVNGLLCEVCNPKTAQKYENFLKMPMHKAQRTFNFG
jgi:formylmethanofuran dehydrogenase subunit E